MYQWFQYLLIFKVFFLQRSTISETQKRSRNYYYSKRLCKTLKFSSSRIRLNRMWTIIICNKLFDKRETETTGDIIRNTPIHKFVKSKNLKVKLICEKKNVDKILGPNWSALNRAGLYLNAMKFGEVLLVHKDNYNFTKFHCIQMKHKKVF